MTLHLISSSLADFTQCHLHQNHPPWQRICNDDTAFSWGLGCSHTGELVARATMKPESGVRGLPAVKITPQQAIFTGQWRTFHCLKQKCPHMMSKGNCGAPRMLIPLPRPPRLTFYLCSCVRGLLASAQASASQPISSTIQRLWPTHFCHLLVVPFFRIHNTI
jgi:hypothetical protein